MQLIINSKKINIITANSFKKRLIGLIGQKNIDHGMLFPKCNSIHTFFMKEPIDIIGLNENNEVIYKYEKLEKNKTIKINYPIKKTSILELPQNTSHNIKLNSILLFKDKHII